MQTIDQMNIICNSLWLFKDIHFIREYIKMHQTVMVLFIFFIILQYQTNILLCVRIRLREWKIQTDFFHAIVRKVEESPMKSAIQAQSIM